MASNDHSMTDSDNDGSLSDALGTEALGVRPLVPTEFQEPSASDPTADRVWVDGKRYPKVDHSANIRMGTPVSKIW